jgi:hypothetical protein
LIASSPKPGDLVEVRPLPEILATLDAQGALEGLCFMPEMVRHCGQRLRVNAVMDQICGGGPGMRRVAGAPLILLEDLRCDGAEHSLCHRGCTILWKPAWLRAAATAGMPASQAPDAAPQPWPYPLKTQTGGWYCQATALAEATAPFGGASRILHGIADVRRGEWTAGEFASVYLEKLGQKVSDLARRPRGEVTGTTPVEVLDLVPGEWVQIKTFEEIAATLDKRGKNRGLEFSRYMTPFCGGTYRVLCRMENFIDERDGSLRKLRNAVILDTVVCGGATPSGPCRRAELLYWREIWLTRVAAPAGA